MSIPGQTLIYFIGITALCPVTLGCPPTLQPLVAFPFKVFGSGTKYFQLLLSERSFEVFEDQDAPAGLGFYSGAFRPRPTCIKKISLRNSMALTLSFVKIGGWIEEKKPKSFPMPWRETVITSLCPCWEPSGRCLGFFPFPPALLPLLWGFFFIALLNPTCRVSPPAPELSLTRLQPPRQVGAAPTPRSRNSFPLGKPPKLVIHPAAPRVPNG